MKKEYAVASPIAVTELMLMGGGMGNTTKLNEPLSIMAIPEGLTEAVRNSQEKILQLMAVDQKHAKKLGRTLTPISIEYRCEIVNSIDSGGVSSEGAYIELLAIVRYE